MYILEFTTMDGETIYRIPFMERSRANKNLVVYRNKMNSSRGESVMLIETDNPYDDYYVVPLQPMFACIHKSN